jgi:hypothetical protein
MFAKGSHRSGQYASNIGSSCSSAPTSRVKAFCQTDRRFARPVARGVPCLVRWTFQGAVMNAAPSGRAVGVVCPGSPARLDGFAVGEACCLVHLGRQTAFTPAAAEVPAPSTRGSRAHSGEASRRQRDGHLRGLPDSGDRGVRGAGDAGVAISLTGRPS